MNAQECLRLVEARRGDRTLRDRLERSNAVAFREEIARRQQAEQAVIAIYRTFAEKMAKSVEHLPDDQVEQRKQLLRLRRRSVALLKEAQEELRQLIVATNRGEIQLAGQRMSKIYGELESSGALETTLSFMLPEEMSTFIRDSVRALNDPLVTDRTLNEKIWDATKGTTSEVMRQISFGILAGESTGQIGRRLTSLLANPEGSARQAGRAKALRTRARRARALGDMEKARELFSKAREKEAELPRPGRGNYRSPAKNAQRIVRTEMARAERVAVIEFAKRNSDLIGGVAWALSSAHPRYDVCDPLVGVYTVDKVPVVPHPHCLCYRYPVPHSRLSGETVRFKERSAQFDSVKERAMGQ